MKEIEIQNLLAYIARSRGTDQFDFISALFGDVQLLRFLDIFSGQVIKVPQRDKVMKLIEYIQVYSYIRQRLPKSQKDIPIKDVEEGFLESAANHFDRRKHSVARIYDKVRKVLIKEREDLYGPVS